MKGDLGMGRPRVAYHSVIRHGWDENDFIIFFIFHIV